MSRLTPPADVIELCRYYGLCDRTVSREMTLTARALRLAELSWRHAHPEHQRPCAEHLEGLRRAWADWRIRALHPRQRQLLLFVSAAALARLEAHPLEARRLLSGALEIARCSFQASDWQPWEGPRPRLEPRVAIALKASEEVAPLGEAPTPGASATAGGEPVSAAIEPAQISPGTTGSFVHISQVLDGIDSWEAVIQEQLGLPLGSFARTGRPDIQQWIDGVGYRALPEEVRAVFWAQVA